MPISKITVEYFDPWEVPKAKDKKQVADAMAKKMADTLQRYVDPTNVRAFLDVPSAGMVPPTVEKLVDAINIRQMQRHDIAQALQADGFPMQDSYGNRLPRLPIKSIKVEELPPLFVPQFLSSFEDHLRQHLPKYRESYQIYRANKAREQIAPHLIKTEDQYIGLEAFEFVRARFGLDKAAVPGLLELCIPVYQEVCYPRANASEETGDNPESLTRDGRMEENVETDNAPTLVELHPYTGEDEQGTKGREDRATLVGIGGPFGTPHTVKPKIAEPAPPTTDSVSSVAKPGDKDRTTHELVSTGKVTTRIPVEDTKRRDTLLGFPTTRIQTTTSAASTSPTLSTTTTAGAEPSTQISKEPKKAANQPPAISRPDATEASIKTTPTVPSRLAVRIQPRRGGRDPSAVTIKGGLEASPEQIAKQAAIAQQQAKKDAARTAKEAQSNTQAAETSQAAQASQIPQTPQAAQSSQIPHLPQAQSLQAQPSQTQSPIQETNPQPPSKK